MLRQTDENHDVYVGPVGIWLPFHPEAYKTGNVQYLEKELNDLMHEKKKNEEKAKLEFDTRVKNSKLEAIKENMEKASENNNKLSQTINEKGELISIENMNLEKAIELVLNEAETSALGDNNKEVLEAVELLQNFYEQYGHQFENYEVN